MPPADADAAPAAHACILGRLRAAFVSARAAGCARDVLVTLRDAHREVRLLRRQCRLVELRAQTELAIIAEEQRADSLVREAHQAVVAERHFHMNERADAQQSYENAERSARRLHQQAIDVLDATWPAPPPTARAVAAELRAARRAPPSSTDGVAQ